MLDHADDCAIATTGVCTCTRGIGQPAAQVTRKLLVEEYQRGKEIGYSDGYKDGEAAATAKWIAATNRGDTLQIPSDATQPIQIVQHHRHRADKHHPSTTKATTKERHDALTTQDDEHALGWIDYLIVLGLALGFAMLIGVGMWLLDIRQWPIATIGVFVALFMGFIIKLSYDNRKRHDVH